MQKLKDHKLAIPQPNGETTYVIVGTGYRNAENEIKNKRRLALKTKANVKGFNKLFNAHTIYTNSGNYETINEYRAKEKKLAKRRKANKVARKMRKLNYRKAS